MRIPILWILLLAKILFSLLTQQSIYGLIANTGSTETYLAITLFRFGAILVSALLINAPPYPSYQMWAGVAAVFVGSFVYGQQTTKKVLKAKNSLPFEVKEPVLPSKGFPSLPTPR